jgi:hypothetical protein
MQSYDTNGVHLGSCMCFPQQEEEHYFGETLTKYLRTEMNGCEMRFIFELVG